LQFLSSSPTIAERWIEQGKTNKNTKFLHLRSGKKVEKKWIDSSTYEVENIHLEKLKNFI